LVVSSDTIGGYMGRGDFNHPGPGEKCGWHAF
jgi:hypothetical protein